LDERRERRLTYAHERSACLPKCLARLIFQRTNERGNATFIGYLAQSPDHRFAKVVLAFAVLPHSMFGHPIQGLDEWRDSSRIGDFPQNLGDMVPYNPRPILEQRYQERYRWCADALQVNHSLMAYRQVWGMEMLDKELDILLILSTHMHTPPYHLVHL